MCLPALRAHYEHLVAPIVWWERREGDCGFSLFCFCLGWGWWILSSRRPADTNRRLCVLNVDEDEVVRSLFVNRASRSIIVVSVFLRDEYKTLKCRSILLECVIISLSHLRVHMYPPPSTIYDI